MGHLKRAMAFNLRHLGLAQQALGAIEQAHASFARSLRLFEEMGDTAGATTLRALLDTVLPPVEQTP
jgi:hypothetical protein